MKKVIRIFFMILIGISTVFSFVLLITITEAPFDPKRIFFIYILPTFLGVLGLFSIHVIESVRNYPDFKTYLKDNKDDASVLFFGLLLAFATLIQIRSINYSKKESLYGNLSKMYSTDIEKAKRALYNFEPVKYLEKIPYPVIAFYRQGEINNWELDLRLIKQRFLPKNDESLKSLIFAQEIRSENGITNYSTVNLFILIKEDENWKLIWKEQFKSSNDPRFQGDQYRKALTPIPSVKSFISEKLNK